MALLFIDGFDVGDAGAKGWTSGSSSTVTRFGVGRSLVQPGTLAFTPANKVFIGFAYKLDGYTNNFNGWLIAIYTTDGVMQLSVNIDITGVILARSNSLAIATGTIPAPISGLGWNYFEISAYIHDTLGTCEIRINGQTIINYSGDTRASGSATQIGFLSQNTYTVGKYYDDLYICDDSGSAPYNTFLGDVRVHTAVPNGAGSSTQWTPDSGANYSRVNEIPYSAANYTQSNTVGQRDTYAMGDLPAAVGTILAVQTNVVAKKTDAGTLNIKTALKSGASVYYGAIGVLSPNDATYRDLRIIDPATSGTWTASAVNSIEAGMEVA